MTHFKSVLTVCKGDFFKIALKIKDIRFKLITMLSYSMDDICQTNEKNLKYPIWKQYDTTLKNEIDRTGIIQDLGFLSLIFKADINIKNI